MTEEHSETTGLKVVSVGRDGKRRYDRQTKQKLVGACLEPGASVAGLAFKHGVNANLLRKWIKLHQQRLAGTSLQPAPTGPPFVPVVEVDSHEAVGRARIREGTPPHPRSKDVVAGHDFGAVDGADAQRRHTPV
ncbi:IS66-like element accessory protein TnpA [Paraburkholderia caledonica]|uniref:Transposase-like protein n=1 Tax=Paraburkholderia caledonica TaxID=134536 RepID=A0AB73IPA3_9BURK|nr:transposase-like protein [Paraburkholderia caledonica]